MNHLKRAQRLRALLDLKARVEAQIENMRQESDEIARLIRDNGATRRDNCGTESGYSWHRRHDEPTCSACRRARADGEAKRAKARANRSAEGERRAS